MRTQKQDTFSVIDLIVNGKTVSKTIIDFKENNETLIPPYIKDEAQIVEHRFSSKKEAEEYLRQ